jgi:hypothetical protein
MFTYHNWYVRGLGVHIEGYQGYQVWLRRVYKQEYEHKLLESQRLVPMQQADRQD